MSATTHTRPPSVADGKRGRRPRRRRIWPFVLVGVLVLALIGGLVWLVGFSTLLAADRVKIDGLKTLTEAQVADEAAIPLGVPLARQNLSVIASRVATFPQAENVVVERSWPDTVTITVTEREPVFAVRYANLYVLVDKSGIPYLTVSKQPRDLPLAAASQDDRASLAEIAVVSRELPKKLRDQVVTIRAGSPYALVLVLDSGVEIAWGTSEQSTLKGQVALALLKQDPKTIDVSSPHNPTIT
ncbi:MAG TPA: FtsQ-type POTRA domain-containing protein [Microlunatus sp.]